MDTISVRAIYRNGVLEPQEKLELPENTPVQVEVTVSATEQQAGPSFFGAFPELLAVTEDDLAWAKRLWEHGNEKQSRLLDGLE